ncbi:MAG TPA: serine/threonine-protein kinase [Polyangiaceae bacterium]|jgi:serine/threonine-protein kinase
MPERDALGRLVITTGSAPTVLADSSPSPLIAPAAGTMLGGKYRVEHVLGQGGMGLVLEATHVGLDQRVAIKFLRNEAKSIPGALDRFAREARACAQVKSDHVVRVFDTGVFETGEPYIVMELLAGEDLRALLERRGVLSPSEVASFVIQACDALAQAHALGIVHRDLKPANLFVAMRADGSGVVKVLDFGISKLHAESGAQTSANVTLGSPRYMSPEQIERPREVDARTDVWALGVVLYEALSARPPFDAPGMVALATAIATAVPAPLPSAVPAELARVVMRCLEKDPRARFASAAELAVALRPFASEEGRMIADRIARAATRDAPVSGFERTVAWSGGDASGRAASGVVKRGGWRAPEILASLAALILVAGAAVFVVAIRASRAPARVAAPTASAPRAAPAPAPLESLEPMTASSSSSPSPEPRAVALEPAHARPQPRPHASAAATLQAPPVSEPAATAPVDLTRALRDRK